MDQYKSIFVFSCINKLFSVKNIDTVNTIFILDLL